MKKMFIVTMFFTGILAAVSLAAQEARFVDMAACPHPYSTTIKGNSHPPAPDLADFPPNFGVTGSVWNQTAVDKHFGHTFHFPAPPKECCLMTYGQLVITIKALQGGAFNTASSGNDGINLFSAGVQFANQAAWPSGATTGQTRTVTFNIPANILAKGEFSLYVQDDTAVVSADLTLRGCCLK
jgi:hypothetical protein